MSWFAVVCFWAWFKESIAVSRLSRRQKHIKPQDSFVSSILVKLITRIWLPPNLLIQGGFRGLMTKEFMCDVMTVGINMSECQFIHWCVWGFHTSCPAELANLGKSPVHQDTQRDPERGTFRGCPHSGPGEGVFSRLTVLGGRGLFSVWVTGIYCPLLNKVESA